MRRAGGGGGLGLAPGALTEKAFFGFLGLA
jgi:hypothetical protein